MLLLAPIVNEYVLMAQLVQSFSVDAPVFTRNFPGAQFKHMEAPDSGEYLPPTQCTQVLAPVVSTYLPAIQLLHVVEFAVEEKVPELQSVQTVVTVSVHHVPTKPVYKLCTSFHSVINIKCVINVTFIIPEVLMYTLPGSVLGLIDAIVLLVSHPQARS
jgi:hypothetical protein